ncbi:ABC transporter ATP-binding protein, partial [Nonomuraea longicatena]
APGLAAAQVAVTAVLAAAPVAAALLTASVIDAVVDGRPWAQVLPLVAALAAAGVAGAACSAAARYLSAESERRIALLTRERLHRAVGSFSGLRPFETPEFRDRLRLAQDSSLMAAGSLTQSATGMTRTVLTGLGFIGSLAAVSPVVAGVAVAAAVPAVLAERALNRRRAAMMWQVSPALRRDLFYAQLQLDLRAAKEIRLFATGPFLLGRMLAERRGADAAERTRDLRESWAQGALAALSALLVGGGLVWAVAAALCGQLTPGQLTLFAAAMAAVQAGLAQLVAEYSQVQRSLLLFGHYLDVLAMDDDLPRGRLPAPPLRHGIELRDVWFRYSPEHPWVLRGVSLFLPYGRAVALVGANGEGKSTVVKLLCRFYDPTLGRILWDGRDLREFTPESLRARIGAVFQDFMEYDLTAGENIALGDLSALGDEPRLARAARLAEVDEVVAGLPQGYDTLLSRLFEDPDGPGTLLSGGQWQRLALARALVREGRDLLVLDEPSAGLDAAAEHRVHTTLREHRAGWTSLLVSHRLGTVRGADHIVVLDGGAVAEEGDHEALMAAGGRYAQLFTLQAADYRSVTP